MTASRSIHPPLVAIFPVIALYSANVGLFPLSDVFRPLVVAFLGGVAIWLIAAALFRSVEKGALVATVGLAAFWSYSPLLGGSELKAYWGWLYVGFWLFIAGFAMRKWNPPTRPLNRFALVLVLVSGGFALMRTVRPAIQQVTTSASSGPTPDIFLLLVDGYGREDQLQRVMHFDNSRFIASLEERGFLVARKSHSNYCQTALSLAATLNMDWVQNLLPKGTNNRGDLSALVDRPRVVRELRSRGYESVAISTGFPGFSFDGFDLVIQDPEIVSYFESTLLDTTPIRIPEGLGASQYRQKQDSLRHAFSAIKGLARPTAKPRFVFAHIMAPHPPFVFNAEGAPIHPKGVFGFWDGSDYMTHVGNPESYRDGYVGQLTWLNGELLKAIDSLREGTIVIIQGDHGSKLGLNQDVLEKTDLAEVFGNLSAYKVPQTIRAKLTDDTTPINAIRAIMGFIVGQESPPLPNRSYYSPFNLPTDFVDVSDRLQPH